MKAILIIGVLGLLLGGGCCGVFWFFGSKAVDVSEDPQHVAAATQAIFQADFLSEFPAKSSVAINIPFVGPMMTMVVYGTDETGMVMAGQMSQQFAQGQNSQQLEAQLRQSMDQQSNKGDVQTISSKSRDLTVRGKPAQFTFAKVKPNSGANKDVETWMVTGAFEGKNGPAFMMIMVPAAKYTEDQLATMIESIK